MRVWSLEALSGGSVEPDVCGAGEEWSWGGVGKGERGNGKGLSWGWHLTWNKSFGK